jgi:broad specificity phosphatase PhoE
MSVLTLVRHGQASYMSEDYDRLSSIGEEQSRRLGEFWARHEITFDACFSGPARRHAGTVEILGDTVRNAGLPWPSVQIVPELDEFDAFRVARVLLPVLLERDAEIRRLNEVFEQNRHTPDAGRLLQKLFEAVSRGWCSGAYDLPDLESWAQFRSRVQTAVDNIRQATGRGQNVAVITSGGVIAATVSQVLDLAPERAIEFVWLTRNASFSEFLFSGDRFSMHSHNSIPHFDDRRLLTYR